MRAKAIQVFCQGLPNAIGPACLLSDLPPAQVFCGIMRFSLRCPLMYVGLRPQCAPWPVTPCQVWSLPAFPTSSLSGGTFIILLRHRGLSQALESSEDICPWSSRYFLSRTFLAVLCCPLPPLGHVSVSFLRKVLPDECPQPATQPSALSPGSQCFSFPSCIPTCYCLCECLVT